MESWNKEDEDDGEEEEEEERWRNNEKIETISEEEAGGFFCFFFCSISKLPSEHATFAWKPEEIQRIACVCAFIY